MSKDNEDSGRKRRRLSENFFGTGTVGERGQIVIPAEARKKFEIETGDKLLIVGHGDKGLMLLKLDSLREFVSVLTEDLQFVEKEYHKQNDDKQDQMEDSN